MATAVVETSPGIPPMTEMSPSVRKALTTAEQAKAIVVKSISERTQAAEMGRAIVQLDKEVEEFFKPMKDAAFKTHREICAKEAEVRKPLDEAKKYLSRQIGTFDAEQEQLRREEEERLQREADEEAKRIAALKAQDQAIDDAIALENEGDKDGAEAVLNNPVPVAVEAAPVIVEKQIPKVAGVSVQATWKFRITDPDLVPREYCVPDEKAIGNVVKGLRGKTNIPGVQVYQDSAARFRA